jgi:integrase
MRIFKRGKFYHYEFIYNGKRVQKSSRLTNRKEAYDAMTKERQRLIRGEYYSPTLVPTLEDFEAVFMEWVRSEKDNERTCQFYQTCFRRLCEFPALGKAKLDQIDEAAIETFKLSVLKTHTRTTCNRYLATLKKALRYAWRKRRLITRMPVIELYAKEPGREFVYDDDAYRSWLEIAPEPLRSASVLARECGICRGELLALEKDCIDLHDYEDSNGFWGTLRMRRGLKRDARRRDLPITRAMAIVLRKLMTLSQSRYVFSALEDRTQPLSVNTLADQHRRVAATGEFDPSAGLHALRHTFLTEAGRYTQNVKALQRLAGHSRVETTMHYIHPTQTDVDIIAAQVQRARQERTAIAKISAALPKPPAISPAVN